MDEQTRIYLDPRTQFDTRGVFLASLRGMLLDRGVTTLAEEANIDNFVEVAWPETMPFPVGSKCIVVMDGTEREVDRELWSNFVRTMLSYHKMTIFVRVLFYVPEAEMDASDYDFVEGGRLYVYQVYDLHCHTDTGIMKPSWRAVDEIAQMLMLDTE